MTMHRAVVAEQTGGTEVLHLTDRTSTDPGPGEVRVRIVVSGVNPTDCKVRRGERPGQPLGVVLHQDGAGTVDAVGPGVDLQVGQRVWVWEAAWQRTEGTAQDLLVLPAEQVVPLPEEASYDLGASLGIPALTAHRCLTVAEGGPDRLGPGALDGRTVLVAGGAGAVGHAAIQLARWSDATVLTTVSSPAKALLAQTAGAHHAVDYTVGDTAAAIRAIVPGGVDVVVEVAPGPNAALDLAVVAPGATIAVYAVDGAPELTLPIRPHMVLGTRWQFVMVYTVPRATKLHAVADVSVAVAAGVLPVGESAGLPLHRFALADTAAAHEAVDRHVVGKVLIDLLPDV